MKLPQNFQKWYLLLWSAYIRVLNLAARMGYFAVCKNGTSSIIGLTLVHRTVSFTASLLERLSSGLSQLRHTVGKVKIPEMLSQVLI